MKKIVLIIAIAMAMTACVKPVEPTKFSILGDSYSTYEGYVEPDSNAVFPYDEIGLTGVEQMWWSQVADSTGLLLERNNSFSGSLICNMNAVNYYGPHSFIRRMNNLGNPDVIFILGGTNDVYYEAPFGDYVYSDWTEEQLCTFRPALAYLLDNMKRLYPNAKLYFLLETHPCPGGIDTETLLNLCIVSPITIMWTALTCMISTRRGGTLMFKGKRTLPTKCWTIFPLKTFNA
jgi:hypothetical protein